MFRYIEDFESIWRMEAAKTLEVFDAIPDGAGGQAVGPEHRDLRRMAWHLCESLVEMPAHMGLRVEGFPGEPYQVPPPGSMQAIREVYATASENLLTQVHGLNNMALAAVYPFYGMTWTGALALHIFVQHQTHHRGQMTVVMRQAGLKPPMVYGPAREDWAGMGLPVPMV